MPTAKTKYNALTHPGRYSGNRPSRRLYFIKHDDWEVDRQLVRADLVIGGDLDREQIDDAESAAYAEGVRAAIEWMLGRTAEEPMEAQEGEEDGL